MMDRVALQSTERELVDLQNRKLALVATTTSNLVVITDRKGQIEWVNDSFERRTGYPLSEVIGRRPGSFLQGPDTDPVTVSEISGLLKREEGFRREILNYPRSGEPYWLMIEVQPIRSDSGDVINFIAIETDITAEKRIIAHQEEARKKAEQMAKAKADFLAVMSHEIRTPLNGVIGNVDLLGDSDLDSEQRRQIDTIRVCGESLLALINDILDLSKVEAGRLELESVPFAPVRLVDEVVSLFADQASAKGLSLDLKPSATLSGGLEGDPTRLRQVIWNLLSNAIKFTERGSVTVQVDGGPISDGHQTIRISVSDTGIGMDTAVRERLFDAFSQGDSSTNRRFGGTGLGMAITQRIVQAMGGTIAVDSADGSGTIFTVSLRLPIAELTDAPGTRSEMRRAITVSGHLLVAEDNPVNQALVKALLERIGCTCRVVADGAEAVTAAQEERFDLILMDCQMPGVDGLEATRRIRAWEASEGGDRLPIIALTADALRDARERCLEAGMDAFLSKPIRQAELSTGLGRFLAVPTD
jgi:PAS domain S-box-containing protein